MHIAIVGNIGAGKTTLAHKLAQHFRWEVFLEEVDDNPYLKDFYSDMPRWAFHLQVYFLNGRFRQTQRIKELVQQGKSVIQDRTIYEDAHIFAANLHESGQLVERDYQNYYALYSILTYLAASKTIEFVVNGIEEYTGVTIISEHSDAIRRALTERLGRGVTVYAGHRGYGSRGEQPSPIDIVFTVVTRLEVSQVTEAVNKLDPKAFMIMHSVNDAKGGMVKKRALH